MGLSESQKREVMQRRGWTCDRCGRRVTSAYGEIHHRDRNPQHNEPDNLRVLCRECHMKVHGKA
ncbi:HNH endonuclease [candidate division WOR-3 bacterium]|nr:HNH endonuclease [candidate division WOR-3 bacterium]